VRHVLGNIARGKSIGEAVKVLARSPNDLSKIERQLEKLTGLQTENMMNEVAQGLLPGVKNLLANVYGRSGVGKISGELYDACVTGVFIVGSDKGFYIFMASGKDKHVYARAGTFRFGAIRGSHLSKYQRGKVKPIMADIGHGWGGAKYQPPKPGFFQFTDREFGALSFGVRDEVAKALKRRGIEVV
jgi:hypothetical protein